MKGLSQLTCSHVRCDQCGESFARLDNLLRHSARHKHGKIFDCATCGKGFHRKVSLVLARVELDLFSPSYRTNCWSTRRFIASTRFPVSSVQKLSTPTTL